MADPAHPDRLPALERADRLGIAGHDRDAEIGSEEFRHRSHDRPALSLGLDERDVRRAGDAAGVIVFEQEQIRTLPQNGAKPSRARTRDRRAGRILRPRGDDDRGGRQSHGSQECIGLHSFIVDRHRHGNERQRSQQIEDAGKTRIFDQNAVAGAELFAKNAFDAVERAADHRDVLARQPLAAEVAARHAHEVAVVQLFAVQPPPHFQSAQQPPRVGQQLAIRIPSHKIADPAGRRGWGGRGGGGGADARPAAALSDRHAALLQDAIGGRHRRSGDPEVFGKMADGGELLARQDFPGGHRGLDAVRDLDRRFPDDVFLF